MNSDAAVDFLKYFKKRDGEEEAGLSCTFNMATKHCSELKCRVRADCAHLKDHRGIPYQCRLPDLSPMENKG